MSKVGIFGAGWVGLVTGACFAELGHTVVVRDVVPEKVDALNEGRIPIHEPGLPELIDKNRDRLTFTTDSAAAAGTRSSSTSASGRPRPTQAMPTCPRSGASSTTSRPWTDARCSR